MAITLSKNKLVPNYPQLTLDNCDYFIFCSLKTDQAEVMCADITLITRSPRLKI
jgi:hypothetical protein